jgi:hypothetical protein
LPGWVPTPASTAPGPALGAVFEIGGVADLGGTVIAGSSAAFGNLIVDETQKMGLGHPGGQHQGGLTPPMAGWCHQRRATCVRPRELLLRNAEEPFGRFQLMMACLSVCCFL